MQSNNSERTPDNPYQGKLLSVVVPAFNEEDVLQEFHRRLAGVLASLPVKSEIVYINDGSTDRSIEIMRTLREADRRIAILDLSRNYGKEIALSAGLDYVRGDAVVVIDADLQDPPELIPTLVQYWQTGFDVVYAKRTAREGETFFKKATSHAFYRLMHHVSKVKIPEDTGDFRLLSRRAVESLRQFREHHRFMKGLFTWIGYPQRAVSYQRDPRHAGKTKWNYWKLWNFALEGMTSFTIAPLKAGTYIGLATSLAAFVYALIIIYKSLVHGDPVRGYPSLMIVILFLGGIQLIAIGIIGEYIGRIFNETKRRPLYFLNDYTPSEDV